MPGQATTSHPKCFPKRAPRNGETAWPGELKDTFFRPALEWSSMSNVASRTYKKKRVLQLWGSICTSNCLRNAPLAPSVAFGRHDGQNHDFWPKSLPKKARPGTGKQHGLASSRTLFFDLRWNDLQCQTFRPEPIKKEDFAAVGLNLHLQLPSKCTVVTPGQNHDFWPKSLPKKARPGTGKQHGLASSRTPFFDLRWNDLQCQTLRPEPIKKEDFAAVGLNLHLQCLRNAPLAPSVAFGRHDGQNHDFWPKSLPKKARPGTGKQHGLASSRTPFFDLRWNDLQCQDFAAVGLNLHLQCLRNAPLAPSVAFGRHDGQNHDFWPKSLPKKARPGTGKQHGLASSRTPFFDLRWNDLQCQTSRPEPIKKEDFAAVGLNLHLQLPSKCTVGTFRCVWASRRAKPRLRTQNASQNVRPETGKQHGLASSRTPFFDLRWSDLQCQTSRPEPIKKRGFCSCGAQFAPPMSSKCTVGAFRCFRCVWASRRQNHDFWPKSLPKKARPGTGKQHGLASSRTPFFDLRWNDLQCQTSRPEPIKKEDFAAVGLNLHLQLPSKCIVRTFRCVWPSRRAKPRLLTQKPSQKGSPRNRETAWPGELKDTVFRPALECSSMSNVASRTYKEDFAAVAPPIAFEMHRWHLPLRLGVTTGKTTTSDPKAFPKRLAPEQGNSMAWRAQGHRFSTCVGMLFNVKRRVQNL